MGISYQFPDLSYRVCEFFSVFLMVWWSFMVEDCKASTSLVGWRHDGKFGEVWRWHWVVMFGCNDGVGWRWSVVVMEVWRESWLGFSRKRKDKKEILGSLGVYQAKNEVHQVTFQTPLVFWHVCSATMAHQPHQLPYPPDVRSLYTKLYKFILKKYKYTHSATSNTRKMSWYYNP